MTLVVAIGSTVTFGALSGVGAGILGGAMLGSGLGAITGAATGQGAGKGALMGAITGGIGGGAAPLVSAAGQAGGMAAQIGTGAAAGAAANAAGAAAGGKPIGESALLGGITGGALAGINAPTEATSVGGPQGVDEMRKVAEETAMQGIHGPSVPAGSAGEQGFFSKIGSAVDGMPGSQIFKNVATFGGAGLGQYMIDQGQKAQDAASASNAQAQAVNQGSNTLAPQVAGIYGSGSTPNNPLGSLGRIGYASGGHVPLRNGAYIIPADVVSALGNGSSKAGAEFLQRLMVQVKHEATKRQGLGAARAYAA